MPFALARAAGAKQEYPDAAIGRAVWVECEIRSNQEAAGKS